jgi:hypothetical protein
MKEKNNTVPGRMDKSQPDEQSGRYAFSTLIFNMKLIPKYFDAVYETKHTSVQLKHHSLTLPAIGESEFTASMMAD